MIYRFEGFELDSDLFELRSQGQRVAAQPKVLSFLFFLAAHHPRAVDRKDVIANVWGDVVVTDAALARVVMEARKALSDASQELLVTVRGRGFRLAVTFEAAPAVPIPAPPAPVRPGAELIGRDLCMAALAVRLADAVAGRPRFAIVSGPSGVGKTRVLEEMARLCASSNVLSCSATCVQGAPAPWQQMLDALLARWPEPGLLEARERLAEPLTVARALTAVSARRPLVLLFDDLQLADDASLTLLRLLSRERPPAHLLIVASLGDSADDGARAPVLLELLGDSGTLSIPLRSLSVDEVGRLVEEVSGTKAPPQLVQAIHKRSGGIPHYVHQLMETAWVEKGLRDGASALASSIDLQPGIMQSIGRRVTTISSEAREVLTAAALLGHDFTFSTLLGAIGGASADLHDRLDEAMRSKLLVARKNDSYEFAHALVSDVLRKGLSTAERARRHREIGERLLAHYGESADLHARELAHHFTRALSEGQPEPAIAFSIRAAEQSALVGADDAAAKHWAGAATALGRVPGYDARRSRVLLELARSRARASDRAGALEACLDAVLLARAFSKAQAQAEAVLLYAELGDATDPRRATLLREALLGLEAGSGAATDDLRRQLASLSA